MYFAILKLYFRIAIVQLRKFRCILRQNCIQNGLMPDLHWTWKNLRYRLKPGFSCFLYPSRISHGWRSRPNLPTRKGQIDYRGRIGWNHPFVKKSRRYNGCPSRCWYYRRNRWSVLCRSSRWACRSFGIAGHKMDRSVYHLRNRWQCNRLLVSWL